jgi:energy-coupling factor transport system permease protein
MDLRAFGVVPRTWLEQLRYRWFDYALIALGVLLFVGLLALAILGYGQLWVPDWALRWAT